MMLGEELKTLFSYPQNEEVLFVQFLLDATLIEIVSSVALELKHVAGQVILIMIIAF